MGNVTVVWFFSSQKNYLQNTKHEKETFLLLVPTPIIEKEIRAKWSVINLQDGIIMIQIHKGGIC